MPKEKDIQKRFFNCFGFSMFAHFAAIIALALIPALSNIAISEIREGTKTPETYYVDLQPPAKGTPQAAAAPAAKAEMLELPTEEVRVASNDIMIPISKKKSAPKQAKVKNKSNKVAKAPRVLPVKAVAPPPEQGDIDVDKSMDKPIPEEEEIADEAVDQEAMEAEILAQEELRARERAQAREEAAQAERDRQELQAQLDAEKKARMAAEEQTRKQEEEKKKMLAEAEQKEEARRKQEQAAAAALAAKAAAQKNDPRQGTMVASNGKNGNVPASYGTSDGIRDAADLSEYPGNVKPVYPERDRLLRNQGTTVFIARVTPDGRVQNVRMETSAGSSSLDSTAFSAFRNYRYMPGQQGLIRKSFVWTLRGDAEEIPARLRRK